MNAVVYKSRIDTWLVASSTGVLLVCVYAGYWLVQQPATAGALALPVLAFAVAVPAWTMLGTRYTLTDEALLVRSGPLSWRIALREITRIEPTRDARSSPALSLDRLRIEYGRGRALMISPADKQRFLRDIAARRTRLPM